jgi:peroxiredoxin
MTRPEKAMPSAVDAADAFSGQERTDKIRANVMHAKVVKYDVELLPQEQFMKSFQDRMVSISPATRSAMLQYAERMQSPPPPLEAMLKELRNGNDKVLREHVVRGIMLGDESASEFAQLLREHDDPVVRFAANLTIASTDSDDPTAVEILYKIVRDKALPQTDRQLICTWCNGVGIRADDSVDNIRQHLANATSDEIKLKAGDMAPEFEFESETGAKITSKELGGKTIVLHFWATSCGPCMYQMPSHIEALSRLDQTRVEILFVSLDDDREEFLKAVQKYEIPFTNLRDERGWGGDLARAFGVRYMPLDVIVGPDGKFVSNSIADLSHLEK